MNKYIEYGKNRIEFHLQFSDRKTLGITVNPDLSVLVKAPINSKLELITEKLKKRAPWIIKQQEYFRKFQPSTPPRKYLSGETHLYLGRQYRLKLKTSLRPGVKLKDGFINLNLKDPQAKDQVKKLLNSWYKERADIIFTDIFKEVSQKFAARKIISDNYIMRDMKKRWGSCTPSKVIIINTELIKSPKKCIEYVIVHELCHLKYRNHDKKFYSLQSAIMPNWEYWKDRLEIIMS